MSDLAAPEILLWQHVEQKVRHIFSLYGYDELRTPLLEKTALFSRSLGDTTDVVQKEMYTFEDAGGRSLTLRPEGTASTVRYMAGLGAEGEQSRVYYMGPMFRRERPQAGRKRQFSQLGAEMGGAPSPVADVEMMLMQQHLLRELGLTHTRVHVNTRGLPEDRATVTAGMLEVLTPLREQLCGDCQRRMEQNVLRVLDCKVESCQALVDGLPPVTDFMCEASRTYLATVQQLLQAVGLDYVYDARLVRGLDYYVHTVWEVRHTGLGAQDALSAGGRYQIELGGRKVDGIGFACGMERLVMALEAEGITAPAVDSKLVWLVARGDEAQQRNLALAQLLRNAGIRTGMDVYGRSMKAQMRAANKAQASTVLIRGEEELANGTIQMKHMHDGTQVSVPEADVVNALS